jgi:hypothetical protein
LAGVRRPRLAELVEDDVPTIAEELPSAVRDRQAIKPGG